MAALPPPGGCIIKPKISFSELFWCKIDEQLLSRSHFSNLSLLLQIITALEDDATAQKMQLGYRLQQIAAAVENKVTDL